MRATIIRVGCLLSAAALGCEDTALWKVPGDPPPETPEMMMTDPPPEAPACTATMQSISLEATPRALDFMFLLDRSGSMNEPIVDGGGDEIPSRFEAAIEILRDLLPTLEAGTVAIQTFPFSELDAARVPVPSNVLGVCASCSDDPSCQPKSCGSDADCRSGICGGGACLCEGQRICDDGFVCAERFCGDNGSGSLDAPSPICNDMIDCNPSGGQTQCRSFNEIYVQGSQPSQEAKCEIERYRDPVLGFTGDSQVILSTIDRLDERGLSDSTPMGTAITGIRPYVEAWQRDHRERRVVQVVMSDGRPQGCDREDPAFIEGLLGEMYRGAGAIPTFMLGFFEREAEELANLDRIAASAGTEAALVVELGVDFGPNFRAALTEVTGQVAACEIAFPQVSPPADPDRLELDLSLMQQAERLAAVYDPADCASVSRGWYFVPGPASGEAPLSLRVCPETCAALRSAASAEIHLSLSCAEPTRDFYR